MKDKECPSEELDVLTERLKKEDKKACKSNTKHKADETTLITIKHGSSLL